MLHGLETYHVPFFSTAWFLLAVHLPIDDSDPTVAGGYRLSPFSPPVAGSVLFLLHRLPSRGSLPSFPWKTKKYLFNRHFHVHQHLFDALTAPPYLNGRRNSNWRSNLTTLTRKGDWRWNRTGNKPKTKTTQRLRNLADQTDESQIPKDQRQKKKKPGRYIGMRTPIACSVDFANQHDVCMWWKPVVSTANFTVGWFFHIKNQEIFPLVDAYHSISNTFNWMIYFFNLSCIS